MNKEEKAIREFCGHHAEWWPSTTQVQEILALAQPEQEPVAWGVFDDNLHDMFFAKEEAQEMVRLKGDGSTVKPLYTTPQIKVGCAECGVGNNHALYCVACAEKFVGEAATKLRQKQESIEGLNRDYDLLFAEHQLLLKKEWVGLTEDEVYKIAFTLEGEHWKKIADAIQNKLKEKNI